MLQQQTLCGHSLNPGSLIRHHCVDTPGVLVVHDVHANLANLFQRSGVIRIFVLDLEVLSEGNEDVQRKLQGSL
jgi:hypothetical protein